jgi:MoxR-like ATPase
MPKKDFVPVEKTWETKTIGSSRWGGKKTGKASKALDAFLSAGVTADKSPSEISSSMANLHELLKANSSSSYPKEKVDNMLNWLLDENGEDVYGASDFNKFDVNPSHVVVHPTFIRAAARRGVIFYVDSKGKFRRQTIKATVGAKIAPEVVVDLSTIDLGFFLKPIWYEDLERFVEAGMRVLLIGPAGVGKSEAVHRIFDARKQELLVVSCNPSMTADDFEGRTELREGPSGATVTEFTPAAPTIALERGYGLLLDEADAVSPESCYALYRILDGRSMHILRKGYDGKIDAHLNFRAIGTQNTEGRGDSQGLFHGRAYQDEAMLDRWNNYIRCSYPEADQEHLILRKKTGLAKRSVAKVVETAGLMRQALEADKVMMSVSLRRTQSVCANLGAGMTAENAWNFALLNRATSEDRTSFKEILNRVYGATLRAKGV